MLLIITLFDSITDIPASFSSLLPDTTTKFLIITPPTVISIVSSVKVPSTTVAEPLP